MTTESAAGTDPAWLEQAARDAFWSDDIGGHHKPGGIPHTWVNIPEVGRENYRTLIRAVLPAIRAGLAAEIEAEDAGQQRDAYWDGFNEGLRVAARIVRGET